MAQLRRVRLTLDPHVSGPDAGTVDSVINFDVRWSAQDKASKQPYTVYAGLWGDDTWDSGVEDGTDDPVMVPAAAQMEISPNGRNVTSHEIVWNGTALDRFDEDPGNSAYDEIRAKVSIVPKAPAPDAAESNHVNLVI